MFGVRMCRMCELEVEFCVLATQEKESNDGGMEHQVGEQNDDESADDDDWGTWIAGPGQPPATDEPDKENDEEYFW